MELKCPKADLLNSVQVVARAIPSTTAEPMLVNILATLEDGRLTLLATDNRISITHQMPVDEIEPGRIAIPGNLFSKVLQAIQTSRSDVVEIKVLENSKLSIESADARYTLSGFEAEDFPLVPTSEPTARFDLPGPLLREMIRKVVVVTSSGMGGMQTYEEVLVEARDGELTLVATDSVRLAIRTEGIGNGELPDLNFLVPSHALVEASRILKGDKKMSWEVSDDQVTIESGLTRLRARLSDKTFPDFRMILPRSQSRNLSINTKEFTDNLKGVIPMAREMKNKIYIDFQSDRLVIGSVSPELGEARREMKAELEGEAIKLAFSGKYLLDFLSVVDSEHFRWGISSATYPSTLSPDTEAPGYTYILMPITH